MEGSEKRDRKFREMKNWQGEKRGIGSLEGGRIRRERKEGRKFRGRKNWKGAKRGIGSLEGGRIGRERKEE